jgi:hypothetical protein
MLILRNRTEYEPGVDENSYLSHLNKDKVKYFLDSYKKFTRKSSLTGSPSKVIADFFKDK